MEGPRHAGSPDSAATERANGDTLKIVSFNIAFARDIDGAIKLLSGTVELRDADLILLQEMDSAGTERIATALGMQYVYYPAIFHRRTKRDFGNAILSRFPIIEDGKIILPHASRYAGTHRIATAATIQAGTARIRVYSTHLGTIWDIGRSARHEQLRAILSDATGYPLAIVGGDMNDAGVGEITAYAGYRWPTRTGPRTTRFGRLDHIFIKGLSLPDTIAAGTVLDGRRVSDHEPIWARAIIPR